MVQQSNQFYLQFFSSSEPSRFAAPIAEKVPITFIFVFIMVIRLVNLFDLLLRFFVSCRSATVSLRNAWCTALWQKLDYRDVRKFEEIDEFLNAMDETEADEDVVAHYDKVVSSDKINVDEDNEEHQDDGVESDWYEDLHEDDVALLDGLDAQLETENQADPKQETTDLEFEECLN